MGNRFAARNQYCWIASITPRKYNKALHKLSPSCPFALSREGELPRKDNGRSLSAPGGSVGRSTGSRAPNSLSSSSRSVMSFSLSLSFSLFLTLPVLFPLCLSHDPSPRRIASRDLQAPEPADSVSFSSSWRALSFSFSLSTAARIADSSRPFVTILEHLSAVLYGLTPLCFSTDKFHTITGERTRVSYGKQLSESLFRDSRARRNRKLRF